MPKNRPLRIIGSDRAGTPAVRKKAFRVTGQLKHGTEALRYLPFEEYRLHFFEMVGSKVTWDTLGNRCELSHPAGTALKPVHMAR